MAYDQSRLEDVHARVSRCLSVVRMRCSRSRQAVIEALAGAGRPLALPDILAAGADQNLAQSSAYLMQRNEEACPFCPNDKSRAETKGILNTIDSALKRGANVYVHCWGGSGRTGVVVGCWLRRHKFVDADNVLGRLKKLRLGDRKGGWKPTPNTEEQRKFIKGWETGE